MRFPWFIIFIFFSPIAALAQYGTITGRIVNAGTKTPLPRASVFLSNSSVGSASAEDGTYSLNYIRPGQYTLVVTILGYEDYSKTVLVGHDPIKIDIQLTPKSLMLREVVIASAADWKKNYDAFRREFIGTDFNAKNCFVMNPHILNITYNQTKQTLHADADEFLVVENRALGYRVKFLLRDFNDDHIAGIISTGGQQVFEELPGSPAEKKKWHERREEAYYGSSMHFFRSLYTNKVNSEGFVMYSFNRYLNPERPTDNVIHKKFKAFAQAGMRDSANRMLELSKMSKYYHENLARPPLQEYEVSNKAAPGLFTLHFPHYLYVVYKNKRDEVDFKDIYRSLDMPNYETTVISINNNDRFLLFDENGIIINGGSLYEGTWSKSRLSELLPVDYVPDNK